MEKNGAAFSADAMTLISQLVGSNRWVMSNELDKLTLYTAGRAINGEDVKAVGSSAQEFDVYDMVDAILEFQAGKAEKSLEQLLLRGVAPAYLLVMLARQMQRLGTMKDMKNRGLPG